jgi:hypothetical protein
MCQNREMFWWGSDRVLGWLSDNDAKQSLNGQWSLGARPELTSNELIHEVIDRALTDPGLEPDERLRLGFGMLDHFDDYAVAMYLAWEFTGVSAPHAHQLDLLWIFCREVLERESELEAVGYWLWVDWFEDPVTSSSTFREMVVGASGLTLESGLDQPVRRRIDRVLRLSGPVPWETKQPVFEAAVRDPHLHDALRVAISAAKQDVYGQLNISAAARLLSQIPEDGRT